MKKTGKLVVVSGTERVDPDRARKDFDILNQQEGSLGGGVERYDLGYLEAKEKGYGHVYYALIFMVWPMDAEMSLGTGVVSRKMAKTFGVKVPRSVDA